MYLDLKLDQTRVVQHSDDTSDSEIIAMIRKRVKPKKSHSKPTKISLPMEDEIENSPVHAEIDSDTGGDVVPQRKRARMSKRKTINQLEINVRLKLNVIKNHLLTHINSYPTSALKRSPLHQMMMMMKMTIQLSREGRKKELKLFQILQTQVLK